MRQAAAGNLLTGHQLHRAACPTLFTSPRFAWNSRYTAQSCCLLSTSSIVMLHRAVQAARLRNEKRKVKRVRSTSPLLPARAAQLEYQPRRRVELAIIGGKKKAAISPATNPLEETPTRRKASGIEETLYSLLVNFSSSLSRLVNIGNHACCEAVNFPCLSSFSRISRASRSKATAFPDDKPFGAKLASL
jgi:hypothetical protein